MQSGKISLDPLLDYLNHLEPGIGETDKFDEWTPSLKTAVTTYLVKEISDEDYQSFIGKLSHSVPAGSHADQVDFAISSNQFWDVQYACHLVVLDAIPDLETLIHVVRGIGFEEIGDWLQRNASYEQRCTLFQAFDPDDSPPEEGDWWIFEYGDWLRTRVRSRRKLLQAWEVVIRPLVTAKPTLDAHAIRVWAMEKGRNVGSRGRLPSSIIQEYMKEQQD